MTDRYFIFGYYGWGNVGDDAMLNVILREFSIVNTEVVFSVLALCPMKIQKDMENKIKFVRPSIIPAITEILKSSTFILGGGTHLYEHRSKIKTFKIQIRIFLLVVFAKIFGKKVLIIGNGFGPFYSNLGTIFPRLICTLSDFTSVRDRRSCKYLKNWNITNNIVESFDLALLLSSPHKELNSKREIKTLGVSVTPLFKYYHDDGKKDNLLIKELSIHLNNWLKGRKDVNIHLFVFHDGIKNNDLSLTEALKDLLESKDQIKLIRYGSDPEKILSLIGQCDAFIGTKYHSCVFAYINNLPMLIIDYHMKCRIFGEEIGLPEYAIISPSEILDGRFGNYFEKFIKFPEDFVSIMPIECARKMADNNFPKKG